MRDPTTPSADWAALARYLSGESTPGEAEAVRRWIDAASDRPALVDALRHVWAEAAVPQQAWDAEAALQRIMSGASAVDLDTRRPRAWQPLVRRALAAAAMLALTVGLAVWRPTLLRQQAAAVPEMREYLTARGQYATVVLADGTRITLAPLSRLRVPRDLDGSAWNVYLDGQALFKVFHDPRRTFRVHTSRATATDLGTTFMVRDYIDGPKAEVMVAEGRVALAASSHGGGAPDSLAARPLVLLAGDLGLIDERGVLSAEHGVSAETYTGWSEGRLAFRRAPLREVAAALSRWYDLDVRFADSAVADRRVTVSFADQPPADVLRLVALTLGLRYEQRGRVITLAPRPIDGGVGR